MTDKQWGQFKLLVRVTVYPLIIFGVLWLFAQVVKVGLKEDEDRLDESRETTSRFNASRIESIGRLWDEAQE